MMKFQVTSSELNRGLSTVIGAVPGKATLPILETILFEAEDDGTLKLTATDLEISMIEKVPATIESGGSVAIPAKRLLDILKQLPNIPVFFEVDDNQNVTFTTDKGKYKLMGEDPQDFPETPNMQAGVTLETESELLKSAIRHTMFAVSSDDLRPAMMGVFFKINSAGSTFVATDGHRLVKVENEGLTSEQELTFIVPDKALNLMSKSLGDGGCSIAVSDNHIQISTDETTMITRLINEQYPNYDSVIPRDNDKILLTDRDQVLSTVKRVSVFSSVTTRQIRLQFMADKLTIRAEDLDMSSEAKETISCEYDGEEMEIGFNSRYLADMLSNLDGNEVRFEFSTPNRAGIIKPAEETGDERMLMLVMPVMLNSYS